MASAVLPSRNESYWGERKVYMRKYHTNKPHFNNFNQTNPVLNPSPNPNRYPISNPALSRQIHENGTTPYHWKKHDEPASRPSPAENGLRREYLTFNLAAYTRAELRELEGRLRSELEQVRNLRAQIENRSAAAYGGDAAAPPPPRPPPLQVDFPSEPKERLVTPKPSGKKRGIPLGSGRGRKRQNAAVSDTSQFGKLLTTTMKRCSQILVKLMKHKSGWVFNAPVDAVALGLHDYHRVIKNPMDLGTVKSRLDKKEYKTPLDFAGDVRLTFDNARMYNPKGSDVCVMAETLVALFDKLFGPAYAKFEDQHRLLAGPMLLNSKESEAMRGREDLGNTTSVQPVVGTPRKLAKPKARDPNKRGMSFEEKERLGLGLQELPPEKMGAMLEIIRRRNSQMTPDGDEIELDIEALDVETLWELDRFVCNHKNKTMKRQGVANAKLEPLIEQMPEAGAIQKAKKGCDAGEEDVDIGEDIPVNVFPPVEIEKDDGSSSSSSSSDSSSSSGSDSGSDSEEDSVQSPFVESKGVEEALT
ncbi:hypothetical protein C3L33_01346, partial [Rhododendron williamsianum]